MAHVGTGRIATVGKFGHQQRISCQPAAAHQFQSGNERQAQNAHAKKRTGVKMKTSSLKILASAAALALLITAKAQAPDDTQAVPPPPADATAPANAQAQDQNGSAPNVIIVPVPQDALPDAGINEAPPEGATNQIVQPSAPGNQNQPDQNQGRNGNGNGDRRTRWQVRDPRQSGQQQSQQSSNSDAAKYVPPAAVGTNGTDEIYLNFHNAPIAEILNYLSDAAGFIIELDTRVSGTVNVWSTHPVSKDEAVQLLNSVLNKNGYTVIRNGRTLRVMTHDDAIHGDIPVNVSNEPDSIPKTDEIVTQIIPIRYVQARQLVTDLSPFVSSRATIMANDAGNSIVVTDTQANIRHLVEIIKAIDGSAEDVTEVRVFHLQYHDPNEVANMLTTVFTDQSGQGNNGGSTPIRFGGFGGQGQQGGFGGFRRFFGGGGQGGGGNGGGNSQNDRLRQRAKVVAVADQRTASVLVTAPKDLMSQIEQLVEQVDRESPKVAHVSVIHLENADPQQVQKVLQDFQ